VTGRGDVARDVSRETTEPPPAAVTVFGDTLEQARAFAEILCGAAVERGLIGPRETGRIWQRHLLNCAVITDLIERGARVIDVGSGAGLPGLVMAIRRPDLQVVLLEPLQRRTDFLQETWTTLGLTNVEVLRLRAEDVPADIPRADVVTARAVAPLDRLVGWCLPLLRPGGRLLAVKGDRAASEVADAAAMLRRLGTVDTSILQMGLDVLDEPTTVVTITADPAVTTDIARSARSGRSSSSNRSNQNTGKTSQTNKTNQTSQTSQRGRQGQQ
jgi:16S rRNA (guanine527-N7)-methyltransferase